ncbi:MAG: hypothetical protein LBH59_01235 [Planctomycetaceae bacterium]|nr:hypothetical protein [Planctomycetaceae bacterium]
MPIKRGGFFGGCVVVWELVCCSYFKIRVAKHGNRNNVERLFKGEAYRPYRLRYRILCVLFMFWI